MHDGLISTRYLFLFCHYTHKGFIGINQDGQPDPPVETEGPLILYGDCTAKLEEKKTNLTILFCTRQDFSQIWLTQQYWALQLVRTPSGGVPNPYILNLGTRLLKTFIWLFFRTPRSSKTLSVHLNFRLFYVFFSLLPKCLKA